MALPVGDVVELVGPDRAILLRPRELLGETSGQLHVVVGIGIGHGGDFDQLGAAEPEHVLLLLALGVRDDDDAAKAERIADQRQPDAGIAGGAFDDDAAGLERPALDRVLDDEQRGAVLDRLAGIHELGLSQNRAAGGRRGALELDQRRVADRFDDTVADLHGKVRNWRQRP